MRASRGMGKIKASKKPGKPKKLRIPKEDRPPKKPASPRLGKPLREFKPRIPPTILG